MHPYPISLVFWPQKNKSLASYEYLRINHFLTLFMWWMDMAFTCLILPIYKLYDHKLLTSTYM